MTTHQLILKKFQEMFPGVIFVEWSIAGKRAIKVRRPNGQRLYFEYEDNHYWKLETLAMYEKESR